MVPSDTEDELRSRKKRNSSPPCSSSDEDNGNGNCNLNHQPNVKKFYKHASYSPHRVNDLLTQEMMQLSVGNRNQINEEMHGVRCMAPEETPEFRNASMRELESELEKIPDHQKKAYLLAVGDDDVSCAKHKHKHKHSPGCPGVPPGYCYAKSPNFRLMFLRCELFDAKKAALRLVRYLDLLTTKLPFGSGTEVLHRPVILSDLGEKEQSVLRKGFVQLLPFRDRSGRRVLAGVASLGLRIDPVVFYKVFLYVLLVAAEDVESQQKGIVVVLWPNPDIANTIQLRFPIHNGGELASAVFQCAPVRVVAYHMCTPKNVPFFQVIRSIFALTLGTGGKRSRLKFHVGEPVELRYQISGYGIPVDLLPLTPTGNVKTSYLKQWIRLRCTFEDALVQNFYTCGVFGVCSGENHTEDHRINCSTEETDEDKELEVDGICVDANSTKSGPGIEPLPNTNTNNNKPMPSHTRSTSTNSTSAPLPSCCGNGASAASEYGIYTMIECPGSLDVVFRPGRPVMNHPGNVTFRSLIESKSDEHDTATQTEKSTIAKGVVDEMIAVRGGRFLVWDEYQGCWTAIRDGNKQRHKVAIAFRNFKSHKKALANRQTSTESVVSAAFERLGHVAVGDEKKRKRGGRRNYTSFCSM